MINATALPVFAVMLFSVASSPQSTQNARLHILRPGDTLWRLAEETYGNRHYSMIIMLHNRLESAERLAVGDTVALPDLSEILATEGVTAVAPAEVQLIERARRTYMAVEDTLFAIRRVASNIPGDPGAPRPALKIPQQIATELRDAAAALFETERGLVNLTAQEKRPPIRAATRFKSAASILEDLAAGSNDGYGYDMDMAHQHLVWGIRNLIAWARGGYQ